MKRNEDFLLRDVAGSLVIVPVGAAVTAFPGMITLNATAAYLWELLETPQTEQTLAQALTERYEVTADQAAEDIKKFLGPLLEIGAVK
jgi:hypothetical protein